jgi:RNA polymerase sigma factor for flagellar operon FliA
MSESSKVEFDASEDDGPVSDDETALWNAYKTGNIPNARERLFSFYANFARNIARRHHRTQSWGDIELADVFQLAYAGLLEALDRFDLDMGTPFRPFAVHRISGSIRDGIARMSEMREQVSWQHRMRRERLQSLVGNADGQAGSMAAIEKLAELAVGLALGFMLEGTGLVANEGAEQDGEISAGTAYDSLVWKETLTHLHRQIASLPDREQTILRQHYLNGMNFDQIAALLRISKGRVSQLHHAALMSLRRRMKEQGHFRMVR